MPVFLLVDGHIGPIHPDLWKAWERAGIGGRCSRCASWLEEGLTGPECPACVRTYQEAKGCRCGGLDLCPECQEAGATEATRGELKCSPECSTLCPICSPED